MKDTELRGILLQKYYDRRRGEMFCPEPSEVEGDMTQQDIASISEQLGEHGLLNWKSVRDIAGNHFGMGRITAHGVDVVEGSAQPNIRIEFVQHKTVNISGSTNVVVGDNNKQTITHHIFELSRAIDNTNAPSAQKEEAKSLLRRFAEHPLVAAVAGGAVGLLGG